MAVIIPDWVTDRIDTQQERYWNPILQRIDPHLMLVKPMSDPPYGLEPNRWHIARLSEHADRVAYIPIQTPDGGFREMDEAMLDALKRMDSHSQRSMRERVLREQRAKRAAEARKEAKRQDKLQEFTERLEQKMTTSIRVPKGV